MSKIDFLPLAYSPVQRQVFPFKRQTPEGEFFVSIVGLDTYDQYEAQRRAGKYTMMYVGNPEQGVLPTDPLDNFAGLSEDLIYDAARIELSIELGQKASGEGARYELVQILAMAKARGNLYEAVLKNVNQASAKLRKLEDDPGN